MCRLSPGSLCLRIGFLIAGMVLLHGCQDPRQLTGPEFARTKADRTLTVTGAGTGSGHVTAPPEGEVPTLDCKITAGTYEPASCSRVYSWKSSVVLTASALAGSTFTGWSGACTGTSSTCKVTMVQARTVKASFSGQSVVSYSLTVVGSGTGSGTVKSQTGLSPAINCTIMTGTATGGTCSGSYPQNTSVVLTATPTSGSFDGWSGSCTGTSTCNLVMTATRVVTATFTAPPGPEASVGQWGPPLSTPVIALHSSLLLNGKLLLWGHLGEPSIGTPGGGFAQILNNTCSNPSTCELFCSGHTFRANGDLLVAGGHDEALGDNNGLRQASIFNGTAWSSTGWMQYRRWYPTLVELGDGKIVAVGGDSIPGGHVGLPERYDGTSWTTLTSAQLVLPLYPRLFVEPKNGRIFYAGEQQTSRYLDPTGFGSWSTSGLGNGGNRVVSDRSYGSAAMLDNKVLYVGGGGYTCPTLPHNSAEVIDLNAATPTWTLTDPMVFRRRHSNATILPDGRVLVTGGTGACGATNETGAVYASEVWDPATGHWTSWASASVVRVYHSTTLLLPDGRVFSSGSGDGGGTTQQYSYEIFSPPYLFNGPRPTYNLSSTSITYGQPFNVSTSNAASIRKVTLIKHGSTTHAFDEAQRLNTLSFTAAADGQSLTVTPPALGRLAPPGPYMLFILNDKGVPSVAQSVLLSP